MNALQNFFSRSRWTSAKLLTRGFVPVAVGISLCLRALAAVSVVGPFTGSLQETFESQPLVYHVPSATVMGGELTISSTNSLVGIYNGSWGLGDKGSLSYSGTIAFGNDGGNTPYSLTFATPVKDFGGLWNAASFNPTITFNFYDTGNNLIGTDAWTTPDNNLLNWHGWSSTTGVKRIDISGGESIPIDNLQVNLVPEPATFGIVALGLTAFAIRRKPGTA